MISFLRRPIVLLAMVLMAAALVGALRAGKGTNLLIASAVGVCIVAATEILMERRIGDAYDAGKAERERRASIYHMQAHRTKKTSGL